VTRGVAWRVHLGAVEAADFDAIIQGTAEQFGAEQACAYAGVRNAALIALREGPDSDKRLL
jgi:hypothetical protein